MEVLLKHFFKTEGVIYSIEKIPRFSVVCILRNNNDRNLCMLNPSFQNANDVQNNIVCAYKRN